MKKIRLIWQLYPPTLLVILLSLVAITWFGTKSFRAFYQEQTAKDLKARLYLVEPQLKHLFFDGRIEELNRVCIELGEKSATRITVIDKSGKVVADSEEIPQNMDNHADRLEVIQAFAGKVGSSIRFSRTLQKRMMYVAIPLYSSEVSSIPPHMAGALRLSLPVNSIVAAFGGISRKIILGFAIIAMAAAFSAWIMSRRISLAIERMRRGAESFARGDFEREITLTPLKNVAREVIELADSMNRMAAQLNQKLAAEVQQKNELEAVFSSMVEAVLVIDRNQCFQNINKAGGALLELDAERIHGKNIIQFIRNLELLHFVQQALKDRGVVENEIVLHTDRSEERYLQAHGTQLLSAGNEVVGALIVLNDVTRLKRLENIRRDFVANVSHELKTPITSIKGFVETLLDGAMGEPHNAARFLDIIKKQADRLDAIVDDLLTLSRLEREEEQSEITMEAANLRTVLESALESCSYKAGEKQIKLKLECPEDLVVRMNPPLLEQAVINLVVNGIKYSAEGADIVVRVEETSHEIKITVIDHGCGISREHLPRLFERFYRSDRARSRKLGGTGLGLSIVKHIMQLHGGRVAVASETGKGSTFTLRLPAGGE